MSKSISDKKRKSKIKKALKYLSYSDAEMLLHKTKMELKSELII
ncbi:hypothetical protein [Polaribacter sp. SA4-12]|nr:hypothetical protein [Polaribacter sp. SA4-12]